MDNIYLLYGTQSGNAEAITNNIYSLLLDKKCECSHMSLNQTIENGNFNFIELNKPAILIVVCSTYGNGDAPETANHFWRKLKNRNQPTNLLKNIQYAVMGLGDTNYDKFCNMGKNIDKRFKELGGERVIELHCADEATNMESIVDSFTEKVLEFLQVTTTG